MKNTGIDRSIPHLGVIMEKKDANSYPQYKLPDGFRFSDFQPEFIEAWANLQLEVEQVDSLQEAKEVFYQDFLMDEGYDWAERKHTDAQAIPEAYPGYTEMMRRIVFVVTDDGTLVGTGSLWTGCTFGEERQRLHWIAVKPEYQGKGIAKVIVTKLLDLNRELFSAKELYLTSQTWSYRALNLYMKFGFTPYMGPQPAKWGAGRFVNGEFVPGDYNELNEEAWKLIDRKINDYRK